MKRAASKVVGSEARHTRASSRPELALLGPHLLVWGARPAWQAERRSEANSTRDHVVHDVTHDVMHYAMHDVIHDVLH